MNLKEFKEALQQVDQIAFKLPNGSFVPAHFHLTEIGKVRKDFIDCGGTRRLEVKASFQLWIAKDYEHRLSVSKLEDIIQMGVGQLGLSEEEIEVEYQGETVGKYAVQFDGAVFLLKPTKTDCLAKEDCGITELLTSADGSNCEPGSGCC